MAAPNFNGNLTAGGKPFFDVAFYGAKGDGTTDDGPAFTRAISAAISAGAQAVFLSPPASSYYIATPVGTIGNGLTIFGPGSGSVTVKSGLTSGYIFDDSNARSNVTFRGITFDLNNNAGGAIELVGTLTDCTLEDVVIKNLNAPSNNWALHLGNVVGGSPTTRGARVSLKNVRLLNNNSGTLEACLIGAIDGVFIDGACVFSGNGPNGTALAIYGFCKNVVIDALFEGNTYQDFYIQQCDNVIIRARLVETGTGYSASRSCSVINSQHIIFERACRFETVQSTHDHIWVFDYTGNFDGNTPLYSDSAYIYDFAEHSGAYNYGLHVGAQHQSDKNVRQTWIFAGGTHNGNTDAAVLINGSSGGAAANATISHIRIFDIHIMDGSWSDAAIWLLGAGSSTITDVLIQNGSIGSNGGTGDGVRADNVTDVRVIGFDGHRNTKPIRTANGGSFVLTKNVPGYTPFGNSGPPTVPATTTWFNNPYSYDCMVYVIGGTVSGVNVASGASGSGSVSTGLTDAAYYVPAGGSIEVVYSAAPTWNWFGL